MSGTKQPAKRRVYQAVCATCYTCVIASGGKRACERAATSHMNAYGHNVSILKGAK